MTKLKSIVFPNVASLGRFRVSRIDTNIPDHRSFTLTLCKDWPFLTVKVEHPTFSEPFYVALDALLGFQFAEEEVKDQVPPAKKNEPKVSYAGMKKKGQKAAA